MTAVVPWNAAWTAEERYEIRPCRWADGRAALWMPHRPGHGKPIFAKPRMVRQRRSVAEMLCTVCDEHTPRYDRWWFKLGRVTEGMFMTTEAPVHRACAERALVLCPHLRNREADLVPFPDGYKIAAAIIGGPATERDFNIRIRPGQTVVGHLKFAWSRPPFISRVRSAAA